MSLGGASSARSFSVRGLLLLALSLGALHASASAQCPVPDRLDGPGCCVLAAEDVRRFPNFTQNTLDLCWKDCILAQSRQLSAVWTNEHPLPDEDCGVRWVRLDLFNPAGTLIWSGRLRQLYSRTWLETDSIGRLVQVWRFLVNGDMVAKPGGGPMPCPVPPCAPSFGNRVRYTGYIDYAETCVTGTIEMAWMLSHVCDFIDHHVGFPRAGMFHPDRSYTFVGPAMGFMPAPVIPTEGTPGSAFEDVRRLVGSDPRLCEQEERFSHVLTPTQQYCQCGIPGSMQWLLASFMGTGVCGTSVTTPGGPYLPGFLSMGIGSWTIPGMFPGVEYLRWNTAGYNYLEPCGGPFDREVFYGVTTIYGYPAMQLMSGPALPLPPIFIDQANSIRPNGMTVMNIPYVSDHILNLNE